MNTNRYGRREYLHKFTGEYWIPAVVGRPISLDAIVSIGLVPNADGKPYPRIDWMADAWRRLADAHDERDTQADAFGPALQ